MTRKTYSDATCVQHLPLSVQSLLKDYGILLQVTEGYIHQYEIKVNFTLGKIRNLRLLSQLGKIVCCEMTAIQFLAQI